MPDVKLCRVCLSSGGKMFASDQYQLKQFYEEITMKKMNTEAGLPHYFCYMCAALLYKFHKFKHKCLTAESMLYQLLEKGPIRSSKITEKYRQCRQSIHLETPIGILLSSKNIKTCIIKRKYKEDCIQTNTKTIEDSKAMDITANIEEQTIYIADIEPDTIKVEETIHSDNDISCPSDDDQISVKTNLSGDKSFIIPIDMNNASDNEHISDNEILCNIKTETDKKDSELNLSNVTEKVKSNCLEHVDIKKKAKKPNKTIESKRKKFEKSVKANVLDPQHWVKINLSEEEAFADHKSRANDPKYVAAKYKCTGCYKWFSKEDIFRRHMKLRHEEAVGQLICRFCGMRYKQKHLLTNHISQHYTKFKCLRCDLVCVLETTAQFHNDSHNGVTRTCKDCGKEFRHLSTYYTHLRSHRSDHLCTICGASFVSNLGLNFHKKSMHVTDNQSEQESTHCAKCDIMFETKKAYDEHFKHSAMHSEGVGDLVDDTPTTSLPKRKVGTKGIPSHCLVCDTKFDTQKEYLKHYSSEHKELSLRVVCEICGQSFTVNSMKSHLNTHNKEKMFTCAICGMKLASKITLQRHQLTHSDEKPVKCTLCDKRFKQKHSMQLHYRTFHLKEPYPKRNRRKKADSDERGLFDDYTNEDDSEGNL